MTLIIHVLREFNIWDKSLYLYANIQISKKKAILVENDK